MSEGLRVLKLFQHITEVKWDSFAPRYWDPDEKTGHRFPQRLSLGCQGQAQTQPGSFIQSPRNAGSPWACSSAPGSSVSLRGTFPTRRLPHGSPVSSEILNVSGRRRSDFFVLLTLRIGLCTRQDFNSVNHKNYIFEEN